VLSHDAPIFLLTAVTMMAAIMPFVGSAIVWVPVCLGFYGLGGSWQLALALAVYCVIVVSMVDNVVKPFILHGQANLHPLLALLSILGGASVLGPIGILVGPMLVSFLQALLLMLRKELERWGDPTTKSMTMMSPAAVALEKSIEAAVEDLKDDKPTKSAHPKSNKDAAPKKKGGKG
jgi:AI-2E family transporter